MKITRHHIIVVYSLLAALLMANISYAQRGKFDTLKVHAIVTKEGDTLEAAAMPPIWIYTRIHLTREMRKRQEAWSRLRNAVYVTYPYAISASKIINDINARLAGVTDKKKRKAIIHSREKELKKEFDGTGISDKDLEDLYKTQYLTFYISDLDESNFEINPIEEEVQRTLDDEKCLAAVNKLPSPYREVMARCFGLADGKEQSVSKISKDLKLPKEDIQGYKEKGIQMLRDIMSVEVN